MYTKTLPKAFLRPAVFFYFLFHLLFYQFTHVVFQIDETPHFFLPCIEQSSSVGTAAVCAHLHTMNLMVVLAADRIAGTFNHSKCAEEICNQFCFFWIRILMGNTVLIKIRMEVRHHAAVSRCTVAESVVP